MDDKSPITDSSKTSIPIKQRLIEIIKSDWLALSCALAITIITIIVVPIVYQIKKTPPPKTEGELTWNNDGKTILDGTSLIDGQYNVSFGLISSIFIDQNDTLYIVDQTNNRILKHVLNTSSIQLIIGSYDGIDSSSLNRPNDIYVTRSSDIYVVDTFNHRILFFVHNSKEGIHIFGTGQPVNETNAITGLNQPMSITMDDNSILYIADYGNNRILSIDSTNPENRSIIIPSSANQRNEYISTPISIKYSSQKNSLVIAQETGFNVVRWILGGKSWSLIAGSASSELSGTSRTLFNQLCSINIDKKNNTYVNDCRNSRIQFYKGDLTKGKTIAGVIQAPGNNSYLFNHSTSIALDSKFNLYVADSKNFRIQKFFQLS